MNHFDHKEQTIQAFRLRDAVYPYLSSGELSQAAGLDMLSQVNGLENWQTWRAQLTRTWAYRRHAAYLPNKPHVVKSLSTRKAVIDDLNDFQDDDTALSQVKQALNRMFRQLNAVRHDELKVDFELQSAIHASSSQSLEELAQRVDGAGRNVKDFLDDYGTTPMTVTNAERYRDLYLSWRLATLSLSLAKLRDQPRTGSLLNLLGRNVDVFGFVAANLLGRLKPNGGLPSEDALDSLTRDLRHEETNTRYFAKAVMLEYLTGSSPEYAKMNDTLELPQWTHSIAQGYSLLDELFPELALWHAWTELKSLLACEADAFYKERNRQLAKQD